MLGDGSQQFHCFQMLDEMLDRLNTMLGHPIMTFPMLGQICFCSKILGDGSQQFHCFQMLDDMLGLVNTSTNIDDIAHAFSYLHKNCVLFAVKDIRSSRKKIVLQ